MGQLPLAPKGPTCFLHADPFCITAPQGTKRAAGCIKPTDGTKRRGHINNNGQQTKSWASVRIKPTWPPSLLYSVVWDGVNPFRRAPRRICSQPTLVPKVCVKCPEFCCIMHRMTLPRRCLVFQSLALLFPSSVWMNNTNSFTCALFGVAWHPTFPSFYVDIDV